MRCFLIGFVYNKSFLVDQKSRNRVYQQAFFAKPINSILFLSSNFTKTKFKLQFIFCNSQNMVLAASSLR